MNIWQLLRETFCSTGIFLGYFHEIFAPAPLKIRANIFTAARRGLSLNFAAVSLVKFEPKRAYGKIFALGSCKFNCVNATLLQFKRVVWITQ
jgi:hypothetical protein